MKKLLFLSLVSLSFSAYSQSYKESECYKKYQTKNENKVDKRKRQTETMLYGYRFRTTDGTLINFRPDNYSPDEIDFFEREVLAAADFDLENYMTTLRKAFSPPSFLSLSYETAKADTPTVTYYEVQEALRSGFQDGELCRWYGILRPNQVAKFVSKKIRADRKEGSSLRAPAVVDMDRSEASKIDHENSEKINLTKSKEE